MRQIDPRELPAIAEFGLRSRPTSARFLSLDPESTIVLVDFESGRDSSNASAVEVILPDPVLRAFVTCGLAAFTGPSRARAIRLRFAPRPAERIVVPANRCAIGIRESEWQPETRVPGVACHLCERIRDARRELPARSPVRRDRALRHACPGDFFVRDVAECVVRKVVGHLPLGVARKQADLCRSALQSFPDLVCRACNRRATGQRMAGGDLDCLRPSKTPVCGVVEDARVQRSQTCRRAGICSSADFRRRRRLVGDEAGSGIDCGDRPHDARYLGSVERAAYFVAAARRG